MRGLSKDFLNAMREKLEKGRNIGHVGWDKHWGHCLFQENMKGPHGFLMTRLLQEVAELIIALSDENEVEIRDEAADVANFAMMIADIHGALD